VPFGGFYATVGEGKPNLKKFVSQWQKNSNAKTLWIQHQNVIFSSLQKNYKAINYQSSRSCWSWTNCMEHFVSSDTPEGDTQSYW